MNRDDTRSAGTRSFASRLSGMGPRFSRPLLGLAAISFAAGLLSGGAIYLDRSPQPQIHVAGTSAWGPHLVLFVLAVASVTYLIRRHGLSPTVFLAPVGHGAAQRLTRTVRSIPTHPTALLRLLLAVMPMAVLVYSPYRIGVQILAGLDPNFTANAWGGPSYPGAMACHYLDAALLIAVSAYLLHRLLLPAGPGKQADPGPQR
ncbi:hypothetical protein [Nocardia brasiliensis]|uniref:hypothetical protein n=1 Tax=Nocardia brasiliensis TaxID=37326 RepID=UPI002455D01F|nr:hypothetical protein [Nocardia brasiliensis]